MRPPDSAAATRQSPNCGPSVCRVNRNPAFRRAVRKRFCSVVAILMFGTGVVSCSSSESKAEAIRGTLKADPFIVRLLQRSGSKMPNPSGVSIFGLALGFSKNLTPEEVKRWAKQDPYRSWSSPTPNRWQRSAEIVYGGGGKDESQVQCFAELSIELSGTSRNYSSAVLLVNYPITSGSC